MTPIHRRAHGSAGTYSSFKSPRASAPRPGSTLPRVRALLFRVVGRTGRLRGLLLVNCPFCDEVHQHAAPPWFTTGPRRAACGSGYYDVTTVGRGSE